MSHCDSEWPLIAILRHPSESFLVDGRNVAWPDIKDALQDDPSSAALAFDLSAERVLSGATCLTTLRWRQPG